jgi:hypothetical protein
MPSPAAATVPASLLTTTAGHRKSFVVQATSEIRSKDFFRIATDLRNDFDPAGGQQISQWSRDCTADQRLDAHGLQSVDTAFGSLIR